MPEVQARSFDEVEQHLASVEGGPRVDSIEEAQRQIAQLYRDRDALILRLGRIEDLFSTLGSPRWERLVFRIDGWGPWYQIRANPRPRPWRRWWTS